jgi:hypothetical protein
LASLNCVIVDLLGFWTFLLLFLWYIQMGYLLVNYPFVLGCYFH